MTEWEYVISDPEGLHARPASKVVLTALKYVSDIHIICRQNSADAKNILELLALGVYRRDKILVRAEGRDEEEALEAVRLTLVQNDDLTPEYG